MTNIEKLKKASEQYYNFGKSFLTDKEFDELYNKEKENNPKDSYFNSIGNKQKNSHWVKFKHIYPLGSQSKCNTKAEFDKWKNKENIEKTVIQEKLDGISIALYYEDNQLVNASTRGNGFEGENIFRNVIKMKNVPLKINEKNLIVRGEIILKHSDFNTVKDNYKNPRNATTGIAKRLDGKYSELLSVIVYDIMSKDYKIEMEKIRVLSNNGFDVVPTYFNENEFDIYHKYNDYKRDDLDYDIDGLVIKQFNIDINDEWERPKKQIAWKFPNKYASSIITDIEWSISGDRLTPVAIFEPIEFKDCTVSRASLNNANLAKSLGVGIGAKVKVSRRNDVIPQIDEVLIEGNELIIPNECPICGGKIIQERDTVFVICSNENCIQKKVREINKWLVTHDTKGISEKTIEKLLEHKIINGLPSFLSIPNNDKLQILITNLEGFGNQKLQILIDVINKTLITNISNVLTSLDINGCSRRNLDKLFQAIFNNGYDKIDFETFIDFIYNKMPNINITDFGEKRKTQIIEDFSNKIGLLYNILLSDIKVEMIQKPTKSDNKNKDISFCFTGKLEKVSRKEAQNMVNDKGYTVKSGVSKGLTYLVTNTPDSGSSKNKKAEKLGTKLITEQQFLSII